MAVDIPAETAVSLITLKWVSSFYSCPAPVCTLGGTFLSPKRYLHVCAEEESHRLFSQSHETRKKKKIKLHLSHIHRKDWGLYRKELSLLNNLWCKWQWFWEWVVSLNNCDTNDGDFENKLCQFDCMLSDNDQYVRNLQILLISVTAAQSFHLLRWEYFDQYHFWS